MRQLFGEKTRKRILPHFIGPESHSVTGVGLRGCKSRKIRVVLYLLKGPFCNEYNSYFNKTNGILLSIRLISTG